MDETDVALLRQHPKWTLVLQAYRAAEGPSPTESWFPRLVDLPEIEPTELSQVHGKLIAHGLLSFDLPSRDSGLMYQLTASARAALAALDPQLSLVAA